MTSHTQTVEEPLSPTSTTSGYAWLVIFVCAAFLFYKYILQVYPSIMTTQLMAEFNLSGAGLGNLAAAFFYTYFIMQIFTGVIIDRYSVRVFSALAVVVSALGVCLFASSDSLAIALLARGLMGVGAAFATVVYMKAAAMWFPANRFAFVGGLLATAAMLGAVFGEAPLAYIMSHFGWRDTLVFCAVLGVVIALCLYVFVKTPKHLKQQSVKSAFDARIRFSDVWAVLRKPQNWLLTFYSGLTFSPVAVFGGLWGNPFISESYHISTTQSATVVSMSFLGLAVGGPVLGYLADRFWGRKRVMLLGNLLALFCITWVIYLPDLSMFELGVYLFLFGFGIGAFMLGFALGRDINPLFVAGTVVALINTGDAICGAFTEPLVGHLLDLRWSGAIVAGAHHFTVENFRHAFFLLPLYLLIATVLLLWIKSRSHQESRLNIG